MELYNYLFLLLKNVVFPIYQAGIIAKKGLHYRTVNFRNQELLWAYIAIVAYLATTAWIGLKYYKLNESSAVSAKTPLLLLGFTAILLHALALYQSTVTSEGLNLAFYSALSLISWVIATVVLISSTVRPVDNLCIIFLPATALSLLLDTLMPHTYILPQDMGVGLRLHILLSVCAYSLLCIAAVQSLVLAFQEHQLHNKHPRGSLRMLPPMQSMEDLLVQLIALGFFLLSLSVSSGLMFVEDILHQHLSHKIVFSILAWLMFALVLFGRWAWGWRGKVLIRWTLGGFALLILAYFGSKLVLELILQRV